MLGGVVLVCAAAAQAPQIGDINFYGLRKITAEQILSAVHLAPGDTVPASKGNLEDQIADMPGVVAAHVDAVCCNGNRSTLFIGIAEEGEPQPVFHPAPSGLATPPDGFMDSYRAYLGAELRAQGKGIAESLTSGEAVSADPAVRGFQNGFIAFAAAHTDVLRVLLHDCSEPEDRAAAATVIGYARDKKSVVVDLQFALLDPDETVRASTARSLAAIATLAERKPALGIRIAPTGFVELLNSIVLGDRMESTKALLLLTDGGRNPADLSRIRERAMPSVAEMARWKTPSYALPPFRLAGRIAGLTDAQIHQSWEPGGRERVIQKALASAASQRRR
jgi:hypothetical protein